MNETNQPGAKDNKAGDAGEVGSAEFGNRINPRSPGDALRPERVPPPPARSQQARHPIVIIMNFAMTILVVGVLGAVGLFFFGKLRFEQASHFGQPRTVSIERGKSLREIAEELHERGLISSKWIFIAGVRASGLQDELKSGDYLIAPRSSMRDIMNAMVSGKAILYSVSIPEGLTSQQIVDRLNADTGLVGEIKEVPPEGSLLPDTYRFSRGDSRQNIIDRMLRERDRVMTAIWTSRDKDLPIETQAELVTLASIVEKETGIADERSRVAAVFINRLRSNMRLQSDPTVIYGIYGGSGLPSGTPIRRSDLDAVNDYNTYKISGLPKGPIANPGKASLAAVANPSRTKDLYFVADGTGGHAFAESYAEHRKNVARYRKWLAEQKAKGDAVPVSAGPGDAVDDGDAPDDAATDAAPVPTPKP
ncbi:endolytic transglycosylase MltG [Kaistia defluvii]|uniref:endolytic transglycosylase MltG n=1 Tax=Kaistia defluvii TaxID=410841 RepID=UPI002256A36E|nr:endolytic transglycosylase MltG [Kaistia defluvii]MCX5519393.1 endolytic transglycosylase MltG [Kaistia defluvii]